MSKTALLFAGQGAQAVGMGKDFAELFPTARELFDRSNAVLAYDLAKVCFQGPEDELTQTRNAQPGIFLVSWVAFQLLKTRVPGLAFEATAGLSLGEFTALTAADVFNFEDGLKLVRERGQFMQEACEATNGGMAAIIGLDESPTKEVCIESGTHLANLNCPGQIVISGESNRIDRACDIAKSRGAKKAVPLNVAGAYHSPLMSSAGPKLQAALARVAFHPPRIPVISNVTAQPHGTVSEIQSLLVQQVTAPVRWEDSIRRLLSLGFTRFIELGPGKALNGFLKRIDKNAQGLNVSDAESLEETAKALS
jgi:[acyl-carrier-protein] S-malonyltransferase